MRVPRYREAAGADHVAIGYGLVPDATNVMRNMDYGQGSAHFVVESLEDVGYKEIKTDEGTRLMFTVEH
jgi:hypothetical protein